MFSGIVEEMATLVGITKDKENIDFRFKCSFVDELSIDQSVAHNGVCLTVVDISDGAYTVTAMKETLDRSNLGLLKLGESVNVERTLGSRQPIFRHCRIIKNQVSQVENLLKVNKLTSQQVVSLVDKSTSYYLLWLLPHLSFGEGTGERLQLVNLQHVVDMRDLSKDNNL